MRKRGKFKKTSKIKRLTHVRGLVRRPLTGRFHPVLEARLDHMQASVGCSRSYAIASCVAKAHGVKRF